jgi:hypothetical protein
VVLELFPILAGSNCSRRGQKSAFSSLNLSAVLPRSPWKLNHWGHGRDQGCEGVEGGRLSSRRIEAKRSVEGSGVVTLLWQGVYEVFWRSSKRLSGTRSAKCERIKRTVTTSSRYAHIKNHTI